MFMFYVLILLCAVSNSYPKPTNVGTTTEDLSELYSIYGAPSREVVLNNTEPPITAEPRSEVSHSNHNLQLQQAINTFTSTEIDRAFKGITRHLRPSEGGSSGQMQALQFPQWAPPALNFDFGLHIFNPRQPIQS